MLRATQHIRARPTHATLLDCKERIDARSKGISSLSLAQTELESLRTLLDALITELLGALADSAESAKIVELDQPAVGRVSRIDAIQQQKMTEANRQAQQSRLQLAQSALRRFENDEFGDCMACGEDVGFARLEARPESAFCIECQTARERT